MRELFNSSVLGELYQSRTNGFKCLLKKEYSKTKDFERSDLLYNKLIEIAQNNIEDKKVQKRFWLLLDDFQGAFIDELNFWCEQYYKLGFCDANNLKSELQGYLKEFASNNDLDVNTESNMKPY